MNRCTSVKKKLITIFSFFLFAALTAQTNCCKTDLVKLFNEKYNRQPNERIQREVLLQIKSEVEKVNESCACYNTADFWWLRANIYNRLANNRFTKPADKTCFLDSAIEVLKNFPKKLLAGNSNGVNARLSGLDELKYEYCFQVKAGEASCNCEKIFKKFGGDSLTRDSVLNEMRKEYDPEKRLIYNAAGEFIAKPSLSLSKQQAAYFNEMENTFITYFYIHFNDLFQDTTNPITMRLISNIKLKAKTPDSCIVSVSISEQKITAIKTILSGTEAYNEICEEAVKKSASFLLGYAESNYVFNIPVRIQPGGGPYVNSRGWILLPVHFNSLKED
jgi:hypothetical protein